MNNKYALPKDGGLIVDKALKDLAQRYEKIATQVYESEYEGVQYVDSASAFIGKPSTYTMSSV